MTKVILGTVAGLALTAAGLQAQGGGVGVGGGFGGGVGVGGGAARTMVEQFQQAGTMMAAAGGRGGSVLSVTTGPAITGRPVSGVEVHKSKQTLGDGTEISTSESDVFYRDSSGRTRVETASQGRTVIVDPVARVTITLSEETKTARRIPMMGPAEGNRVSVGSSTEMARTMAAVSLAPPGSASTYSFDISDGGSTTTATVTGGAVAVGRAPRAARAGSDNMQHEDLGAQSMYGVLATGTRNTLTIPQGQIGNNRDIHVINERWYSDDLQMLLKTVNSDPRFGENTYEFTNISRDEPNPALFQIPGDYNIVDMSVGRGVVTPFVK